MADEKILDKLGKIKAHMESAQELGNEAEAQAFAGMLQQLLLKHKLEMTDIQYSREMQDEPIVQHTPETVFVSSDPGPRFSTVSELAAVEWKNLPKAVRSYLVSGGTLPLAPFADEKTWQVAYNAMNAEARYSLLHEENGVGMSKEFPNHKWYPRSQKSYKRFYKEYPDVEILKARVSWIEELASIVADAYSCRILISTGSSIIHFVGHKSNVKIAEYLFVTMMRTCNKLSEQAAKKFRQEWRAAHGAGNTPENYRESWIKGFTTRIYERLKEERRKFETPTSNTALVRINKEALAVKNYMDEKFNKGKKADALQGRRGFNREGYEEGKKMANGLNISGNAVNAGSPNRQLN